MMSSLESSQTRGQRLQPNNLHKPWKELQLCVCVCVFWHHLERVQSCVTVICHYAPNPFLHINKTPFLLHLQAAHNGTSAVPATAAAAATAATTAAAAAATAAAAAAATTAAAAAAPWWCWWSFRRFAAPDGRAHAGRRPSTGKGMVY